VDLRRLLLRGGKGKEEEKKKGKEKEGKEGRYR